MRMSEEKRAEFYRAISDPVMDERLKINRPALAKRGPHLIDSDEIDKMLFDLESAIWRNVHKTLKLEGPP